MKLYRKVFSKRNEEEVKLGKSHRGLGRSMEDGIVQGIITYKSGKKAADKAAKEGKSEAEVVEVAGKEAKKISRGLNTAIAVAGATSAGLSTRDAIRLAQENISAKDLIRVVGKDGAKILVKAGKHKGKIAAGVGAASALAAVPSIIRKGQHAESGAMKNTVERIKKGKEQPKQPKKNKK